MKVESQHMSFITGNSELSHQALILRHVTFFANTDTIHFFTFVLSCAYYICRGQHGVGDTLQSCGVSEGSTVSFSLSTFSDETSHNDTFFINDVVPSVQQTQKGISVLLSSLYAVVSFIS